MNEIKPIETVYNGYKFRSRLEARWAVFFDAAGIKYIYEPDGYKIPCTYHGNYVGNPGINETDVYLPDFYLPDFDIYAEVKGSDAQLKQASGKLGDAIDYESTPMSKAGLIILGQIPYRDVFHDGKGDAIPVFHTLYWHKGVASGYCAFAYFFKQREPHTLLRLDYYAHYGCPIPNQVSTECEWWDLSEEFGYYIDAARTMYPYEKARQARFEHGETPKP